MGKYVETLLSLKTCKLFEISPQRDDLLLWFRFMHEICSNKKASGEMEQIKKCS